MNISGIFKYIFVTVIATAAILYYISTLQKADTESIHLDTAEFDRDTYLMKAEMAENAKDRAFYMKLVEQKQAEIDKQRGAVERATKKANVATEKVGDFAQKNGADIKENDNKKEFEDLEKELKALK